MKRWIACSVVLGFLLGPGTIIYAESRDAVKLGGNLVVEEGMSVRDAVVIGGDTAVDGTVERNVVAIAGSVFLGPKAEVGGDVIAIGGIIEKEEGAQVQGSMVEFTPPGLSSFIASLGNWREIFGNFRLISIITSIGFLALALLIVSLFPKPVGIISAAIEKNVLRVIGWGILGVLLIAPLAILLAISIVGIVLIPLEIIFFVSATLMGYIAVAQLMGKKMTVALKKPNQPMFWETVLGLTLLWVIGFVPFFGGMVKLIAALLGLGGVILSLIGIRRG